MTPSNGKQHGTLYEQVLDFARREIEDASSKIDELRRSLHLLEARVEAAKSVYESVAARLNLEDELENEEVQRDAPLYAASPPPPSTPPAPPMFVPDSSAQAPPPAPEPAPQAPISQQTSTPPPSAQAPPPAPEPAPLASASSPPSIPLPPAPEPESASAASGNNGASDGFSMDLIRRHLEARDRAAQEASAGPPRRSEHAANAPSEAQPASSPPAVPPAAAAPEANPEQPASQGGFPGLSEADRALIGEYLRSKRGK